MSGPFPSHATLAVMDGGVWVFDPGDVGAISRIYTDTNTVVTVRLGCPLCQYE